MTDPDGKPHFDTELASSFIGKHVLIGLTFLDDKDNFIEQKQMHGTIVVSDEHKGFGIELKGEHDVEMFWLPPDLRLFRKAPPGEYRLRSTGEVVVDPDLTCTWIVNKPTQQDAGLPFCQP